jgi:hypothetical protein
MQSGNEWDMSRTGRAWENSQYGAIAPSLDKMFPHVRQLLIIEQLLHQIGSRTISNGNQHAFVWTIAANLLSVWFLAHFAQIYHLRMQSAI